MVVFPELNEIKSVRSFPKPVGKWGKGFIRFFAIKPV